MNKLTFSAPLARLLAIYRQVPAWAEDHPWVRQHLATANRYQAAARYLVKGMELFLQGFLLVIFTLALLLMLLAFVKGASHLYLGTRVGREFAVFRPDLAAGLATLRDMNPAAVGVELVGMVLGLGLALAAIMRFLELTDYFYHSRALLGKISIFAVPLAGAAGLLSHREIGLQWQVAVGIALVPALCLFAFCFRASDEMVPRAGKLVKPFLPLYLLWQIAHQCLMLTTLALASTFAALVAYDHLYYVYAKKLRGLLPNIFVQLAQYLSGLGYGDIFMLALRLVAFSFLAAFIFGVVLHVVGIFPWITKRKAWQRVLLLGLPLSWCGSLCFPPVIQFTSRQLAWWLALLPCAILCQVGLFAAHSLLVNLPGHAWLAQKIARRWRATIPTQPDSLGADDSTG